MICVEVSIEGRRANVFMDRWHDIGVVEAFAAESFWDEEDRYREFVLRALLQAHTVRAVAFPTIPHDDVLQVFLQDDRMEDQVFACTIVTPTRLRALLRSAPMICEGFTFQVAPNEHLTIESTRVGVETWMQRVFPDIALPVITLGIPSELSLLVLPRPYGGAEPPSDNNSVALTPDPQLAQPPYEEAA